MPSIRQNMKKRNDALDDAMGPGYEVKKKKKPVAKRTHVNQFTINELRKMSLEEFSKLDQTY